MSIPQRLSIVTLGVSDVARATAFYESLGWRQATASQESITFFQMQGSVLALFGRELLADDAQIDAEGSGFRAVTTAINFDNPEQVDAAFVEWVAAGGTPVKAPETVFWGGYSSYVADLDGHLWELAHNPYSPNDVDGRMQLGE